MPLLKTNGYVTIGSKNRRVFIIRENKKGDVYISIRTGENHGDTAETPKVKQTRFSLHPTSNSPTVSAIKYQTLLADGTLDDHVSYTSAARSNEARYFPICFTRYTALQGPQYDWDPSRVAADHNLALRELDPNTSSLTTGFFVGSPTAPFPLSDIALSLYSRYFQIVIFSATTPPKPTIFANTQSAGTTDPASIKNPVLSDAMTEFMKGMHALDCVAYLEFRHHLLTLSQLDRLERMQTYSEEQLASFAEARTGIKQLADAAFSRLPKFALDIHLFGPDDDIAET